MTTQNSQNWTQETLFSGINVCSPDDVSCSYNGNYKYNAAISNSPWSTGLGTYITQNTQSLPPWVTTTTTTDHHTLKVMGDADIKGDLKLKGRSLSDTLDAIERRLAILKPNVELEEKWNKLKELGDEYRKLEAEIIEKEKVWSILKK